MSKGEVHSDGIAQDRKLELTVQLGDNFFYVEGLFELLREFPGWG
jgi:hypothetical protein